MASSSALSVAMPTAPRARRFPAGLAGGGSDAFLPSLRPSIRVLRPAAARLQVRASSSMKEKATASLTAAALAAALVLPDIAEAAQPGVSPSLKNFLLSIVAGGVVLVVLLGAVIAVANFDPVKRS